MQRLMQSAIEDDDYLGYQCLIALQELSGLSCLDIGTLNTLNNMMNVSVPISDDLSDYTGLPAGNLMGSSGSYLLHGSNCYPQITGDGRINAYDISVLMWSYFGDSPYDSVALTSTTVTARKDESQLCQYSRDNNIKRNDYSIALADSPCDPFGLTGYEIPSVTGWDYAMGLSTLMAT